MSEEYSDKRIKICPIMTAGKVNPIHVGHGGRAIQDRVECAEKECALWDVSGNSGCGQCGLLTKR